MRRPFLLLVAGLVAALLLSACGATGDPAAATVNSTDIKRSDYQDELSALVNNKKFVAFVQKNQNLNIKPTSASISPEVSSQWLNLLINQSVIDRAFEQRHLKIDPRVKTQAEAQAAQVFGGADVFNAFPKWFRDEMIGREERVAALSAALPPFQPSDAALEQYFNSSMPCPTNQLIEHILVSTEADANAVEAQLAAGADFATLAQQRSIDTGSAQVGGALWCSASQQLVNADKDFQAGVLATPVGTTSRPVKSQFGYHVIRVVPWTFADAKGLVLRQYLQQVENPLTRFINSSLRKADVWVDPRDGNVRRTGGTVVIQAPQAPNPKSRPPLPTSTSLPVAPSP